MRLDPDLVRILLLQIENKPAGSDPEPLFIEGYDELIIEEHLELLDEAGYITGWLGNAGYWPGRLTWKGHEFVNNCKDESIWNQSKAIIKERVSSVSLDILSSVALGVIKSNLGLV